VEKQGERPSFTPIQSTRTSRVMWKLSCSEEEWFVIISSPFVWVLYLDKCEQAVSILKVKGKVVPPRHEGVLWSGGIAPRILDFGTRWRCVVSFTPRPIYPQGNSLRYPLDRRLDGPQSRSGRGGEEKNSHPLPGLETPDHSDRSPALYWLSSEDK
jgi:hypothetical protein